MNTNSQFKFFSVGSYLFYIFIRAKIFYSSPSDIDMFQIFQLQNILSIILFSIEVNVSFSYYDPFIFKFSDKSLKIITELERNYWAIYFQEHVCKRTYDKKWLDLNHVKYRAPLKGILILAKRSKTVIS